LSAKWLGINGRGQGERVAVWELAAETRAASRARRLTTETLRQWRVADPADVDDIVLMVDELIANAVVHGQGRVTLLLRMDGPQIVAEVSDENPVAPKPPRPPTDMDWSEAGRGLLLVDALSTEFGTRHEESGKTVWFTRILYTVTNLTHQPEPIPDTEFTTH
jgi:anti-sigma regulatory factor (Ser/Thr protein kinase)